MCETFINAPLSIFKGQLPRKWRNGDCSPELLQFVCLWVLGVCLFVFGFGVSFLHLLGIQSLLKNTHLFKDCVSLSFLSGNSSLPNFIKQASDVHERADQETPQKPKYRCYILKQHI